MAYKLTDLIGWGKADARIHLDALKDGITLKKLEEQLLTRNELFEFDILRDLRLPELIKVIDAWGRKPSEFNVEDVVEDIKTRKPNRKLIVEVKESPSFIDRYEADLYIEEEKKGEWQRIPSTYPGFLLAKNETEKTIDDEIQRTVKFLERRYLPGLIEKEFTPAEYNIKKIKATNVRTEKDRTYADIEVEIGKSKPRIKYDTATEYWEKVMAPALTSKKMSAAQKKIQLTHFQKELTQTYAEQTGQQKLQTVQRTINILSRLLETKMLVEEDYAKIFTEIESDSPIIDKKESIQVKGLFEKYADDKTIENLCDHNNANKFYTDAFKFQMKNARVKLE